MVKTSMSHEDYLEAIVMLGGTTDAPVRSVDVANKLGVSKASVNKAISALKEQELVVQPHYGDITLTEAGYAYGRSVLDRHR
ncbi:MAG: metal-dependent transcriptional regulator, partial [Adlercreutzia sp.]